MSREVHVRFWERVRVKSPRATRLPLYRLNEIFARMGVDIPDSTLVDWCGRAMQVLRPLIERIEKEIMKSDVLSLVRAVNLHRLGRFRDRSHENLSIRASAFNLVVTAIIHWNTIYTGRVIDALRNTGQTIRDHLLSSLPPLIWEHVNPTSDYLGGENLTLDDCISPYPVS